MDNISKRKKYLEELLIEVGFLKKEDNQWDNEKDKMCKRKHRVLEYSDKIKKEFLEFLVDLKENSQEKLITNNFREDKEEFYRINHYFYQDLFEEEFDVDKNQFFSILLNKIEEVSNYKNLKIKFLEEKELRKYLKEPESLTMAREFIRDTRIVSGKIREDFHRILYSEKIEMIRMDTEFRYFLELEKCKFWLEYLFVDTYRQLVYYDVFQQLIVYDVITDRISEIERENNYKKMSEILDSFSNLLVDEEKFLKEKKHTSKIFIDFFCFIILREKLLKAKKTIEIGEVIKDDMYGEILPLDKKVHFFNAMIEATEEKEKKGFKDMIIECVNFIELEEIKDKIDADTLTISLNKCKNLIENFRLTQGDKSKIIYGKTKINKFNEKQEDLEAIISIYPFFTKKSLQVKKVIASNIENDNRVIYPFRKTLKALIKDDVLRNSEAVINHIRMRVTKGLYEEKENLKGFKMSIDLEKKINGILIKIYSYKNRETREEYMNKFIDHFFEGLISINNDKIILTTQEGKEIAEAVKSFRGPNKELSFKEIYDISKEFVVDIISETYIYGKRQ